ncbi:phage holin family protein [Candidatus Parcubacteria bacterium]|nr:phage holin family protein [Candidatus Parcubacteria bacterium]
MKILVQIVANGIGLWVARELLAPNFQLTGGFGTIALTAIVLGIIQAFAKPVLKLFSFPLIILTLGLFNLVINVVILWLLDRILPQLSISGGWTYLWAVGILGIASLFVHMAFPKDHLETE